MSDLAAGMGWSIYLMLGMVALVVTAIVILIISSDSKAGDSKRTPAK